MPIEIPIKIAPKIPNASCNSPTKELITAAPMRINIIGSVKLSPNSSQNVLPSFIVNSFNPYLSFLSSTSLSSSPISGFVFKYFNTSLVGLL